VNSKKTLLFLGLDNAGKTTLLHMLKFGTLKTSFPTQQPTMEELALGNITLKAFDMGGHKNARSIWQNYFPVVDGIVFIVDAADPNRFEEAKQVLSDLLVCDELEDVPLLVLGNKIDLSRAVSEEQLRDDLALHQFTNQPENGTQDKETRPLSLFMCSVVTRQGYAQGFRWLGKHL